MKESVAIAKEADTKKDFSPTKSDKSIHRVNEPERQLGSLRDVIGNIRHDGGTPSVDSVATELSKMPAAAQRAPVLLALQRTHGNQYVQRAVALARKGHGETEAVLDVEQAIQRVRGGGQALDSKVRGQMESAFGADFGSVRIHTDTQADTLNHALNARAFTTGQDIFFRQGAYNSNSSSGRELLAHELTHVVQQNRDSVQRKLTVGKPGDRYEQEAEQMARAVMRQEQKTKAHKLDEGRIGRQDRPIIQMQRAEPPEPSQSPFAQGPMRAVERGTDVWRTEIWDTSWSDEKLGAVKVIWDYIKDSRGNRRIYHAYWVPENINRWLGVGAEINSNSVNLFGKGDSTEEAEIWFKITVTGPKNTVTSGVGASVGLHSELSAGFEEAGLSAGAKAGLSAGLSWSKSTVKSAGGAMSAITRKHIVNKTGTYPQKAHVTNIEDLVIDDDEGPEGDAWWQNDWHIYNLNTTLT